jgi:hypothetical protein
LRADVVDGRLVHGALAVPIDGALDRALAGRRSAVVGVRPDDFCLASDAGQAPRGAVRVEARPSALEYLGPGQELRFDLGAGTDCVAMVDAHAPLTLGGPVALSVDVARVHLFDEGDGATFDSGHSVDDLGRCA